jgi:hypothetical protein
MFGSCGSGRKRPLHGAHGDHMAFLCTGVWVWADRRFKSMLAVLAIGRSVPTEAPWHRVRVAAQCAESKRVWALDWWRNGINAEKREVVRPRRMRYVAAGRNRYDRHVGNDGVRLGWQSAELLVAANYPVRDVSRQHDCDGHDHAECWYWQMPVGAEDRVQCIRDVGV